MAKLTTTDITAGYALTTVYNTNLDAIEAAMELTLSRDGTAPNTMSAELDMNSNKVTNVSAPTAGADAANKTYVDLIGTTVVTSSLDVADESTDTTCFPVFVTAATGILPASTGSGLTFNSNTDDLNSTLIAGIANANLVDKSAVEVVSGQWSMESLRVEDTANTDYVAFTHDGTDLNIAGTNTTDINITSITALSAGTVDADFDAITATSYGGITEANLVDKSAAETIAGAWIHSTSGQTTPAIMLTAAGPFIGWDETDAGADESHWRLGCASGNWKLLAGSDASPGGVTTPILVNRSGTTISQISLTAGVVDLLGGSDLDIRDAGYVRIRDSGDTDYLQMSHDGTDMNFAFTNTMDLNLKDGIDLKVWDAGNTDNIMIAHTGTNIHFTSTNTTNWDVIDLGGTFKIRDGAAFAIQDAGDTDYVSMAHNGTDFDMTFVNTTDINVIDLSGNLWLRDGAGLKISDSTDADHVIMAHDGTDLNVTGTQTTEINILGIADGIKIWDAGNTDYIAIDHDGSNATLRFANTTSLDMFGGIDFRIRDAGDLVILDAGDTDSVTMGHDGTDFNIAGTNTADINLTGITSINLPNASSLQGADLGAADTWLIGMWSDDIIYAGATGHVFHMDGSEVRTNDSFFVYDTGLTDYMQMFHDGTDMNFIHANTADLNIRDGVVVKIFEAADVDNVAFSHDGTDFNMAGTNTAEVNLLGVAGGLKIWDSGNTDNVSFSHDDTDFNITGFQTADLDIEGFDQVVLLGGTDIQVRAAGNMQFFDSTDADSLQMRHDGTDVIFAATGTTDLNITGVTTLKMTGSISMVEQAAAPADAVTYGQLWVKNDDPNVLMYTDGDGTDFVVTVV